LWYLLATLFFVLAMLAKPASVVTPLLALIIATTGFACELAQIARRLKRIAIPLAIWLLLTLPIIVEGKRIQPAPGVPDMAWWARPLIAGDALAFYLWKLLVPISLCTDYSRTPASVLRSGVAYWTWLAPAAALCGAFLMRKRWPRVLTALLLFIAAPLPVLGFVKFIYQFFSTVSDHYVYVAMLGPALAAGVIAGRVKGKPLARPVFGCVLGALGVLTFVHAGYWIDDFTLFDHAVEVNPRSAISQVGLGAAYEQHGQMARAIECFRRAVELDPHYAHPRRVLGMALLRSGDLPGAAEQLRAGVNIDPQDAGLRVNLAGVLAQLNQFDEARQQIERAIRLDPSHPQPQVNLAMLLAHQGDFSGAAEHYRRALAIDPNCQVASDQLQALTAQKQPATTSPR
jgi:protein O-mannosyl-transferase